MEQHSAKGLPPQNRRASCCLGSPGCHGIWYPKSASKCMLMQYLSPSLLNITKGSHLRNSPKFFLRALKYLKLHGLATRLTIPTELLAIAANYQSSNVTMTLTLSDRSNDCVIKSQSIVQQLMMVFALSRMCSARRRACRLGTGPPPLR